MELYVSKVYSTSVHNVGDGTLRANVDGSSPTLLHSVLECRVPSSYDFL